MTHSEIVHVQNECETDVCVTERLINDCIQEESTVQNDWLQTNHKGTDKKGMQIYNIHLEFNGQGLQKNFKI